MQLHADLSLDAKVQTEGLPWVPSPASGVFRRRIERNGHEVARLTSLVRYDKGCRFPTHVHGGGEEFLVLSGTFSDEHRDYPAGTYVRNGVGTSHAPFTRDGCIILVRLWWMHPEETEVSVTDTRSSTEVVQVLHEGVHERVALHRLEGGLEIDEPGGIEVFVLDGDLQGHPRGTWLRKARGPLRLVAAEPARLLIRTGHLANPPALPSTP